MMTCWIDKVVLKLDDVRTGGPNGTIIPCEAGPTGGASAVTRPWDSTYCHDHPCTAPGGVYTAACAASECGAQLQAAFDSCCGTVTVPPRADGSPWVTSRTLLFRSNSSVTFQPGVTILAKRGFFKTKGAPLFLARNITNLTIVGYGATFKMWKHDYDDPSLGYCHSEARPGLWLGSNCFGCRVFGLTVTLSGGDGIEVVQSRDIHLKDLVLDNNYRNALSVVGVENMLVANCTFSNTGVGAGTSPMAGAPILSSLVEGRAWVAFACPCAMYTTRH